MFHSDGLMTLMRDIGRGYLALCSYNCREAINILSQLPSHHYNTGWVLGQVGRAHFELAEYMQVSQGCLNQMTSIMKSSLVSREVWGASECHAHLCVVLSQR